MIYGILIGISIMLVLFLCVFIGYKLSKPKQVVQTKEEIEIVKKRDEGILNVMNYDVNVALGKKVRE